MGGEGGVKRLATGAPFVGLAAESQREVEAELATDGRAAIVQRAAIRLEAVARLFYNAVLSATEQEDFTKLAQYAQRYGWLQARALGAWAQVKQEVKDGDKGTSAHEVLEAIRGNDNGNGE
jgi:hypothetical protein